MRTYYFLLFTVLFLSCKPNTTSEAPPYSPRPDSIEIKMVHIDTAYEYEKRTGTSGNYEYTYDVIGTDEQGNEVTGQVEVEGKSGNGVITNNNDEEIAVEVEWSGHGILKAVDQEGKEYQLQTAK